MKFSLNIDYSFEEMEKSRRRMEAWPKFRYEDRVPVSFCLVPRYFTRIFGIEYNEIFKDAQTQYYWLLQFAKHQIENIPCDYCTGPVVYVHPYFDNVTASSAFGSDIRWPYDETPQAVPTMRDVGEIESYQIPEPDAALWGKTIEWWHQMKELAQETDIRFRGQKGRVEVAPLSLVGLGPHMIAIDLVGPNFYWWMLEYPKECHQLLDKITQGLIRAEELGRKIDSRPRGAFGLAEDSSQIMSDEMFKAFTVPYDRILYERFGSGLQDGRGMHMCGDSRHLLKTLANDLKISSFNLFGYKVPPETAAAELGGKALLYGNINPMLMLTGTRMEVRKACMEALAAMAPCGGLMLGDGANVCPGTPAENLAVLAETAEEYALLHPELFPVK